VKKGGKGYSPRKGHATAFNEKNRCGNDNQRGKWNPVAEPVAKDRRGSYLGGIVKAGSHLNDAKEKVGPRSGTGRRRIYQFKKLLSGSRNKISSQLSLYVIGDFPPDPAEEE